MSDLINEQGKRIVVVAERADGVLESLHTTEQLAKFFEREPAAKLKFVEVNNVRP